MRGGERIGDGLPMTNVGYKEAGRADARVEGSMAVWDLSVATGIEYC